MPEIILLTDGILCARCNHAIGHADDSVKKLQAMIEYLRQSMQ